MHRWSEEQLKAFETSLASFRFIRDFGLALRAERGSLNGMVENYLAENEGVTSAKTMGFATFLFPDKEDDFWGRIYPALFSRSDQAFFNGAIQQRIDLFDEASRTGFLRDDKNLDAAFVSLKRRILAADRYALSLLYFNDGFEPPDRHVAFIQDTIIQARIACALERYWLRNGSYPLTLSALVPDFMPEIPNDLMTGKPMIYRRTASDKFLLYSVGWDRVDDGGSPADRGKPTGDWVWGTLRY
jgi:hypothetical protein